MIFTLFFKNPTIMLFLAFPESVVRGLTTEVVVASYNSNSLNIIVLISSYFFSLNLIDF